MERTLYCTACCTGTTVNTVRRSGCRSAQQHPHYNGGRHARYRASGDTCERVLPMQRAVARYGARVVARGEPAERARTIPVLEYPTGPYTRTVSYKFENEN